MKHIWKKAAALSVTTALIVYSMPVNAGTRNRFSDAGIVAHAEVTVRGDCGKDNSRDIMWTLEDGTLTISGTGK